MMKHILSSLLFLGIFTTSFAQSTKEQTIESIVQNGQFFSFKLTPPPGWILDLKNTDNLALAVLYPQNSNWATTPTVLYANYEIWNTNEPTITKRVARDIEDTKKNEPTIIIETKPDITINTTTKAKVVYFLGSTKQGDGFTDYFANAYIPDKSGTVFIIMNSRDKADFYKKIPIFEQVVKSYKFAQSSK